MTSVRRSAAADAIPLPLSLRAAVDAALDEAFARDFHVDELLGRELSAIKSPIDSCIRRHGILIERAIACALATAPYLEVMSQVRVPLTHAALEVAATNAERTTRDLALPVAGGERAVILDIVAYDWRNHRASLISVKRGGGAQGGRAAREDRLDLRAAAMTLRSLLAGRGFPVTETEILTVDWLGRSGIRACTLLTRSTIDAHFGLPIAATVEAMSALFAEGIATRIEGLLPVAARRTSIATAAPTVVSTEPASARGNVLSLADCLAELPRRMRGRQMAAVAG